MPLKSATCGRELEAGLRIHSSAYLCTTSGQVPYHPTSSIYENRRLHSKPCYVERKRRRAELFQRSAASPQNRPVRRGRCDGSPYFGGHNLDILTSVQSLSRTVACCRGSFTAITCGFPCW